MLPNTRINIDKLIFSPWQEWQGKLSLALTSDIQQLRYQGEKVKFQGQLKGQQLTVSELDVVAFENQPPVKLVGGIYYAARAGWTSCKWACYCDVKLAAGTVTGGCRAGLAGK